MNDATGQTKYIAFTDKLPNGWRYGTFQKGKHRAEDFREKLSKALKGRKVTEATRQKISNISRDYRWYTDGKTNVRIKFDAPILNGFYRGRVL